MNVFALSDESLAAVFDQIPAVAAQPREFRDLSGGLTNRNLLITNASGRYVARCSDPAGHALAIDRDVEHANSRAAEEAGVGAPVIDYRPDLGVLLLGFVEGRTLSRETLAQESALLPRMARAIRQLHQGPEFQGEFNMFERMRGYLSTVQENGYRYPSDYLDHAERIEEIRTALAVKSDGLVPCNNDLLPENFIDDGEKIWLIDYEYSGNNDACFELGNTWAEGDLDLDQLEALVTGYYGRPLRNRIARARLLGQVGRYGWTLWGCIQAATSPQDFDFWGWGMERYELAVAELRGPDLTRLLDEVTADD